MIEFILPNELIAKRPAYPRDSARLLVYDRKTKKITDTVFREIKSFLPQDSALVLNNSKVEKCRWLFPVSKTEVFVINKIDAHTVQALVRPGKKFKSGTIIDLDNDVWARIISIDENGMRTLKLSKPHDSKIFKKYEHIPLPPYIPQDDSLSEEYQTVYAKPLGSKAAPTAGLHFTDGLLKKIKSDHPIYEITLHVGLGTFAPITKKNIKQRKLHSEHYELSSDVFTNIKEAKHIISVGTTTCRTLETIFSQSHPVLVGSTDIFIYPGHDFRRVNSLITNFHLPGTSLLLLVEAFVGNKSETQRIYDHAITKNYRFYSFGDVMYIV